VRLLQEQAGNRATAVLLAAGQPKLTVSAAGDRYEQEADDVAAQVVARLRAGPAGAQGAEGPAAGVLSDDDREAPAGRISRVQRSSEVIGAAGGDVDSDTEKAIVAARSGGRPLPGGVRRSMEGAFGADFGGVKVHTGEHAQALNHQVGAVAFTVGPDIFLGRSAPDVTSPAGQDLLAHELTHTIQQGAATARHEDL
jgi:hypothetical protein